MSSIIKLAVVGLCVVGASGALAAKSYAATPKPAAISRTLGNALPRLPISVTKRPTLVAADTFKEVADTVKSMVKGSIVSDRTIISKAASQAF